MTDVPERDLWMRFRIVEGEGAHHINRFLSGKLADTAQNAKLLFVNHDDGGELDLTEIDTENLIFQKLSTKRVKLNGSVVDATIVDHQVITLAQGNYVFIATFLAC